MMHTRVRQVLPLAALALAGCATQQPVVIEQARVEHAAGGDYRVLWTTQPPGAAVDVLLAKSPGPADRSGRPVSRADRDGVHEIALPATPRPYFRLHARGGRDVTVAERMLPLEGGRNFRDLGGYLTESGRQVRWGLLYRSGVMAGLTDADYRYLAGLGIRTICDFRSTDERTREALQWRLSDAPRVLARDYRMDLSAFASLMSGRLAPEALTAGMAKLYEDTPYEFAADYRAMFAELLAGHAPLAFNCSAGKDRTGVAAALILLALGVPRATVLDDYMLSNAAANMDGVAKGVVPGNDPAMAALARLPPEVRKLMTGVQREWLEAALAAIEKRDGSIPAYLGQRLGVGPAEIETLRARYLE